MWNGSTTSCALSGPLQWAGMCKRIYMYETSIYLAKGSRSYAHFNFGIIDNLKFIFYLFCRQKHTYAYATSLHGILVTLIYDSNNQNAIYWIRIANVYFNRAERNLNKIQTDLILKLMKIDCLMFSDLHKYFCVDCWHNLNQEDLQQHWKLQMHTY